VLNVHRNHKAYYGPPSVISLMVSVDVKKGEGEGGMSVGGDGDYILYINIHLSLHCHHQNDSCIKMNSGESHFNVSSTVRNKVRKQCPQTTTFFEEKGEPKPSPARHFSFSLAGILPCLTEFCPASQSRIISHLAGSPLPSSIWCQMNPSRLLLSMQSRSS